MLKKTAIATLIGVAVATAVPAHAASFTILAGDYKMTVDSYTNGTFYGAGCGTLAATPGDVTACDAGIVAHGGLGLGGPISGAPNPSEDTWGILSVASIVKNDVNPEVTYFTRGVNGYLTGVFYGLTDYFVSVTPFGQSELALGGSIKLYENASNYVPATPSTSRAAIETALSAGPLWLSADFTPAAGFGPALLASYTGNVDFLTGLVGGGGYLDVTGGSAMTNYDTNGILLADGHLADARFSVTAFLPTPSNPAFGNWDVISTNQVVGTALPEPGSLALLGGALFGLAALRRRK